MQGCDFDFVLCCSRYDDMVLEAVTGLKEPYGSSTASIATYIEVYNFLFFFGNPYQLPTVQVLLLPLARASLSRV